MGKQPPTSQGSDLSSLPHTREATGTRPKCSEKARRGLPGVEEAVEREMSTPLLEGCEPRASERGSIVPKDTQEGQDRELGQECR